MEAKSQTSKYLLCYDISDPARLNRIARKLKDKALRLQKSIFILKSSPTQLKGVIRTVLAMMDQGADDFRVYELAGNETDHIGVPYVAEGLFLKV